MDELVTLGLRTGIPCGSQSVGVSWTAGPGDQNHQPIRGTLV